MTSTTPRIIRLGGAIITIMNAGDMMVNMAEEMAVPESERRHLYGSTLEGPQPFPSQSVHISLADASILVDINTYALAISLAPSYLPPDYSPPPEVVEQLLSQGIHPEDITHLVITHAHARSLYRYNDRTRWKLYPALSQCARLFRACRL